MSEGRDRSLQATIAAHELHAHHDSRELTANARAAFLRRFEDAVDPDRVLEPEERKRRADHARQAYMLRLSRRSAETRAKRKSSTPLRVSDGVYVGPGDNTWFSMLWFTDGLSDQAKFVGSFIGAPLVLPWMMSDWIESTTTMDADTIRSAVDELIAVGLVTTCDGACGLHDKTAWHVVPIG